MKKTKLITFEVKIDETHNLLVLKRKSNIMRVTEETYDFYIMGPNGLGGETPYCFMYSVPAEQQTLSEAIETAVQNAPNYFFLLED